MKIQDKEFFGNIGRTDISDAANAAIRKKMIDQLAESEPTLQRAYRSALWQSGATAHFLLKSGRYPLTGQGDVNTYSVFAETMRTIVGPTGAAGVLTPTGLATDKTTAPFFSDTLSSQRLYAFYDFENEEKFFKDVDHKVRFAATTMTGKARTVTRSRFAFRTRYLADLQSRRFQLAAEEVLKLNPNTGTLPMFSTRTDADINVRIYARHPVLIRDDDPEGNPWGLTFGTIFHMSNDSRLFLQEKDLGSAHFNGWSYADGVSEHLPLYEAKMLSHFDHRFSTYLGATQAQLNVGSLPRLSEKEHDDPNLEPRARYWVKRSEVEARLDKRWDRDWVLGWRRITKAEQMRTFIPFVLPLAAAGDSIFLALPTEPVNATCLHGTWSSLVFDYVARQKLSGLNMNYYLAKQLACPTPETFGDAPRWDQSSTLAQWVVAYVLELSYTSWRLKPYAEDLGDDGPPFHWDPERRALLWADLDAGFLHVYGLDREEAEHVLDSFTVVRKYEERDLGEYRTKRFVLEAYDRMAQAIADGGKGWEPLADPPAGTGPRHSRRDEQ